MKTDLASETVDELPYSSPPAKPAPQETPELRNKLNQLPSAARFLVWPLLVLVLIHSLLVATWAAPGTPVREEIGADNLRSYILPTFEQNWSIFAPNPRRVAVTFEVRAQMQDPSSGDTYTTDWVDLVEGEDQEIRHNFFPSRTSGMARRTADRLHNARANMNETQIEWVEANFVETPIEDLASGLRDVSGGAGATQINNYMTADQVAVNLATGYARYAWEGEVVHVQFRTSTRPAPSYQNRHEQTVDDTNPTVREYGWRAPAEISDHELEYFERYAQQAGADR